MLKGHYQINHILLSIYFMSQIVLSETIRQNFNSMAELNTFWDLSAWTNENRTHSPSNVSIKDSVLVLKLSGSQAGQKPVCAEITSKRSNFKYGSYRASIKTTNIAGAVVGWFVYRGSPLNEIDIEFLTRDISQVYFTLHHITTNVDHQVKKIAFDPSTAFHEYRFDWYPNRVDYYIDSKYITSLTKSVPDSFATIMLNHWSGNITGWGGDAPTQDVYMYVDYMEYRSELEVPVLKTIQSKTYQETPYTLHMFGNQVIVVNNSSEDDHTQNPIFHIQGSRGQ